MARGSITPRPTNDGKIRYRIKWESRGPDGKRKHHSATRATKKAAEALLAEKLDEVEKMHPRRSVQRDRRLVHRTLAGRYWPAPHPRHRL
jgi:hypothetical protein